MLISIVFFLFIRVDSRILQLVLRLLLIPVIAGVSYEFIRLAGRYDNRLVNTEQTGTLDAEDDNKRAG